MASSITLSLPRSLSLFPTTRSFSLFPTTLSHSSDPHRHFILLHFHLHRIYPRIHASRRISNFPQQGLGIEEYEDGDDDDEEEEEEEEDRSLDLLVKFVENVFKKISRKARKAVRSVLPVTISTKLVGFSVNGVILLAFLWVLKAFLEVNHPKSKVPFNDHFAFAVETGRILCTIFCAFLFKAILNKWDPNTGGFQQAEFQNGIPFANSIIIAQEVIYLVVCTIGSVVFVSILFIRGVWSGLSYLQQSHKYRANEFDDDNHAWTGGQPVS